MLTSPLSVRWTLIWRSKEFVGLPSWYSTAKVKQVYWVIKGPLKWRFYDYWKIQRNETIEQICAGLSYLYDHDLSHNNLDLRTIFMIQSGTGDRPVIGGFDRLSKMSLAIDASSLARIIIAGELVRHPSPSAYVPGRTSSSCDPWFRSCI